MSSSEWVENSLLPLNASELEHNLEQVVIQAVELPVRIKDLWDPDTCPLSILPWLAWAFSVDEWDERWPTYIKRQVVKNSFDVHRFKGTPYAMQKALDSLNIKTDLREWWEPDGSQIPGTITVVALINENLTGDDDGLLTQTMLMQVTQAIQNARRGVIHFRVELGIALDETLGLSGAIGSSIDTIDYTAEPLPVLPDATSIGLGFAAASRMDCIIDQAMACLPLVPDVLWGGPQQAGVCRCLCLSDIDFKGTI